jgi:enoyl-CoA hydratase/carnithine racemase
LRLETLDWPKPVVAAVQGHALGGAVVDATTAFAWGLAEEVVPANALYERALEFCRTLAGQPQLAMAMAKLLINQATAAAIRTGIGQELLAQTALFSSAEYRGAKKQRQEG